MGTVIALLLLLEAILMTSAEIQQVGPCPAVSAFPNFNLSRFMGPWYEQMHTMKTGGNTALECSYHRFKLNSSSDFTYDTYSRTAENKTIFHTKGSVLLKSHVDGSNILEITEDGEQSSAMVLGTDYVSYVTIWSCMNSDTSHYEDSVILTRERFPTLSALLAALDVLNLNNLSLSHLVYTEQRSCPDFSSGAFDIPIISAGTSAPSTAATSTSASSTTPIPPTPESPIVSPVTIPSVQATPATVSATTIPEPTSTLSSPKSEILIITPTVEATSSPSTPVHTSLSSTPASNPTLNSSGTSWFTSNYSVISTSMDPTISSITEPPVIVTLPTAIPPVFSNSTNMPNISQITSDYPPWYQIITSVPETNNTPTINQTMPPPVTSDATSRSPPPPISATSAPTLIITDKTLSDVHGAPSATAAGSITSVSANASSTTTQGNATSPPKATLPGPVKSSAIAGVDSQMFHFGLVFSALLIFNL